MSTGDFDLKALYVALDEQRQARGLTWAQATREINAVGPPAPRHPIATSTITGLRTKTMAEGAGVLQMLRWLCRAPESFVDNLPPGRVSRRHAPDALVARAGVEIYPVVGNVASGFSRDRT
jgi:hypothetical protein